MPDLRWSHSPHPDLDVQSMVAAHPQPFIPHTPSEKQVIFPFLVFLKPLLYRCTPWPEIARPTAQTGDFGIKEVPVGRDSTQHAGPNRDLGRIMARAAPVPAPSATSTITASHTALSPQRHGRGRGASTRKPRRGLVGAVCLPSIRGNPPTTTPPVPVAAVSAPRILWRCALL